MQVLKLAFPCPQHLQRARHTVTLCCCFTCWVETQHLLLVSSANSPSQCWKQMSPLQFWMSPSSLLSQPPFLAISVCTLQISSLLQQMAQARKNQMACPWLPKETLANVGKLSAWLKCCCFQPLWGLNPLQRSAAHRERASSHLQSATSLHCREICHHF